MNRLFDFEDEITKPRLFWFLSLGCYWMTKVIAKADQVFEKAKAELATRWAITQWWNKNEPGQAWSRTIFWGVVALVLVFAIAHAIAMLQLFIVKAVAQKRQERAFAGKLRVIELENAEHSRLSRTTQAKKELIMRLGSIDQFVRVLEIETDISRRTVALQAAHSEITILAAKLASGQISNDLLDATDVRELAKETSADLTRHGLSDDRLNRDLIRMFKLTSNESPKALLNSNPSD